MKNLFLIFIVIGIFSSILKSENFDSYFVLLENGKYNYIKDKLPYLKQKFPNSADVLYISGIIEENGEKSLSIFQDVLKKYPNSYLADDAFLKIIEFSYTRGLYNKTIIQSQNMLKKYKDSKHIQNCLNMLLCSYCTVNKIDSAAYYYNIFLEKYPNLNLTFYDSQYQTDFTIIKENELVKTNYTSAENASTNIDDIQENDQQFVLQFGAFSSPTNALFLRNKLKSKGYNAYIKKITGNNGTLTAVRIGFFTTRRKAIKAGKQIKRKEKLEYMVVNSN